jgi:hypothetical protein
MAKTLKKTAKKPKGEYRRKVESDNATNRRRSREGRDIAADYPPAGDKKRRAACEGDLRRFCESYFPAAFSLAWSDGL